MSYYLYVFQLVWCLASLYDVCPLVYLLPSCMLFCSIWCLSTCITYSFLYNVYTTLWYLSTSVCCTALCLPARILFNMYMMLVHEHGQGILRFWHRRLAEHLRTLLKTELRKHGVTQHWVMAVGRMFGELRPTTGKMTWTRHSRWGWGWSFQESGQGHPQCSHSAWKISSITYSCRHKREQKGLLLDGFYQLSGVGQVLFSGAGGYSGGKQERPHPYNRGKERG